MVKQKKTVVYKAHTKAEAENVAKGIRDVRRRAGLPVNGVVKVALASGGHYGVILVKKKSK